jgi:heme exporter protein B
VIAALIWRDIRSMWSSGALWLPLMFFLMVIVIFPFAVGPDAMLLARTGGGMIWVATLLAALLPVDQIIAPDADDGTIDQFVLRGISEEAIIFAKWIAHLAGFGVPLMLISLPASLLLAIAPDQRINLVAGLAMGAPGLAALAVMVAALGAGTRTSSVVSSLAMLPLAIPIVIFGAGSLNMGARGGFEGLAATVLLIIAMMPFVGGAALRAARE